MEISLVKWSHWLHTLSLWMTGQITGPPRAVRLSTDERFENESIG